MSVVGNRRPVSTTTIRPSYSTTVMFFPISPSPPSGRTRSFVLLTPPSPPRNRPSGGHRQEPVALEHRADDGELHVVELDVRQSRSADRNADHAERRLEAARRGRDREVVICVLKACVDLPA